LQKHDFHCFRTAAEADAALIREALTPAAISGKRIALLQ
jgi:hypothetical protein